jgi:NADPH-dependent curcumin reductase
MPETTCRRVALARRPRGAPAPEDFRLEEAPVPEPREGEALVRTVWLSLDPYMRGRMSDAPSYAPSVAIGAAMTGECVGEVVASRAPSLAEGDLVRGFGGWRSHFALPADQLTRLDPGEAPISTALGVLGMPGLTAYAGLLAIGEPRPGETVVVGAATGAVGAVAGQIAKLKGCRVVGVAGGRGKCDFAVRELGLDACLQPSSRQTTLAREWACGPEDRTTSSAMMRSMLGNAARAAGGTPSPGGPAPGPPGRPTMMRPTIPATSCGTQR